MREKIQAIVNNFGFGISVQELAEKVYWQLVADGENPCIVNDRYIEVNGANFQLIKARAKGHWVVKEF